MNHVAGAGRQKVRLWVVLSPSPSKLEDGKEVLLERLCGLGSDFSTQEVCQLLLNSLINEIRNFIHYDHSNNALNLGIYTSQLVSIKIKE